MKTWLDGIQKASPDYQYDSELIEINTDEDSEEFECNLKELEVRTALTKIVHLRL